MPARNNDEYHVIDSLRYMWGETVRRSRIMTSEARVYANGQLIAMVGEPKIAIDLNSLKKDRFKGIGY